MSSNAITVANAVVTELNATTRSWFGKFIAARGWLPVYKLEDLADLTVTVVPFQRTSERLSRSQLRYEYKIGINFQQAAQALTLTDLDALANLIDGDVTAYWQDWHYLTGLDQTQASNKQWSVNDVQMMGDDLYDLDRLYTEGIFDATLVLTIRGNQP